MVSLISVILFFLIVRRINDTLKNKSANPLNIPVGQQGCTWDWDCDGWSLFGDVACCNTMCVQKDYTIQTCDSYCAENPFQCTPT